ncbi:MAG TPA: 1-phosphofructokinase [Thermoanaerobaculia bacterium]|nr:1-phosphofructokinase [Thermoanaerobaculia bacterium]
MKERSVLTVTLNPAIDQTLSIPGFAAGRVNRVAESRSNAGGKGVNVACFLADLDVRVIAMGFLGEENRSLFERAFERRHITDRFVTLDGFTRVGLKIVDDSGQTTDINFPGLSPEKEDLADLLASMESLVEPGGWCVLSGSVPAGVPDGVYGEMIERIRRLGGRVVLDTSGAPLRKALEIALPDILKPNVEELAELVGRPLATPADVRGAAGSLLARGIPLVVVSMGGAGALFLDGEQALLARPPKVPVHSTVGAGDAMVAGIVYAKLRNLPLPDLARFATGSGAYAVTRVGLGIDDQEAHRKLIERVEIG